MEDNTITKIEVQETPKPCFCKNEKRIPSAWDEWCVSCYRRGKKIYLCKKCQYECESCRVFSLCKPCYMRCHK